jgi:hypothetical protein
LFYAIWRWLYEAWRLFYAKEAKNSGITIIKLTSDTKAISGFVERAAEWVFGSLYHRLHRLTSLVDDAVADIFADPPLTPLVAGQV